MYAKLVLRNARRSIQDYLVYLLTITICVTLFYSFLSISSSHYEPDIGTEYDFTMLSGGMKLAICAVTLILLFLIRFVNHYMLRRKQREFALQSVMGMEQRTIGRLWQDHRYLIDPHTAVAFDVLDQYRRETGDGTPAIVVSTASPFKFCDSVLTALGVREQAEGTAILDQLSDLTGVPVPAPLAALKDKAVRFRETVARERMADPVLEMLR